MSVYEEATRHVDNLGIYALIFPPYTSLISYYFDLALYDIQKENHSTATNRGYVNISTYQRFPFLYVQKTIIIYTLYNITHRYYYFYYAVINT